MEAYEYATDSLNGCDPECQLDCYEAIEDALKARDSFSCPKVDSVSFCMAVRRDAWVELLKECPLLKVASSEAEAEAEAPTEAEAEAEAPAEEGEAEAEAPAEAEAEAPAEEGEAAVTSRQAGSDGEAEAPVSEDAEAEAEAPASEDAEAEAEAPASEDAEAEAAAPSPSAEGEADGECSAAAAEAEAESDGQGCWPDFENYDDLERFIEGAYYSTVFAAPSNTAGIIISVFFWIGLAGTGAWLGRIKKSG